MRCYIGVAETQKTNATGKCESLWPCRSWIEQQRFAEPFRFGLMRMTKDADIGLFAFKKCETFLYQLPAFVHDMTDRDAAACQFDHGLGRKSTLFIRVDVAGDGGDWRNLPQLFDHGATADVPSVENVIDAFEMLSNRWIE